MAARKNNPERKREIKQLVEKLRTSRDEDTRREAALSLGEIGTGNPAAIEALVELLRTTENKYTRIQAAESLGRIDPGNPAAIEALVELLRTSKHEYARIPAAESLGKIDTGNPVAIKALVELLRTSKNEYTRIQAAESLEKIGTGNPVAIEALVKLLRTSKNEYTRREAAESLGKIGTGNPVAIEALVELLRTSKDTRREAAESLGKIGTGNPVAIEALVELLRTSKDEYTRREAAENLWKIDPGSPAAIEALVKLLRTGQNEYIRMETVESLWRIDPGNPVAIEALVKLLRTSHYEYTRMEAAKSLWRIDPGNSVVIEVLVELLNTSQHEDIPNKVIENLEEIVTGNNVFIEALVELLRTCQNNYIRKKAIEGLEKIGTGNPTAIVALVELLHTDQDKLIRIEAAKSLQKIAPGNSTAIEALEELLRTSQDEDPQKQVAKSLEKIASGNPVVIKALVKLMLNKTRNAESRKQDAEILKKIGIGNLQVIEKLRKFRHDKDVYTSWLVEQVLQKIDSFSFQQDQDLLLFLDITRVRNTADRYFSINNTKKTEFCYHRIIACLDKMQTGHDIFTRRSLLKSYLDTYQKIINFALKRKDFVRVFFYTEIFRNRYLVERLSQQDAPLPNTINPELSQAIKQAQQRENEALQIYTNSISQNFPEQKLEQLAQQWDEEKRKLENLYTQVAAIEPEFIAKTKVTPLTYSEIQDILPSDTAILEFFFTQEKLLTMLILPQAESPIFPEELCLDMPATPLENIAQAWVKELNSKLNKNEDIEQFIQQLNHSINQLSDLLNFKQLLKYIPDHIQHLIIVPHNYLHLFPIHAFWVKGAENKRLIDNFSVSYFPSLQVWKICQQRQRNRNTLIGIENPTQDRDLIFAKAEMASISQRQFFSQSQVLTGKNTSREAIMKTISNYHCFHFSGHAEYDFTNPLNSYLMLADNGAENLTLNTIFTDWQMPETDLVALSACCTGVVDAFQPTEEYLGLPTGFLLAGAKAVIASQWKVNSIASAFFFDEFYRQLETTDNKALALQNAQNWLRQCQSDELKKRAEKWDLSKLESKERFRLKSALRRLQGISFQKPYYWAAFFLTGC